MFFNLLLLFLGTPIIIRGLGAVDYGIYIILVTVSGVLAIANLGLGEATLRYVAEHYAKNEEEHVKKVFSSTFLLYAGLGGFLVFIFFLFPLPIARMLGLADNPDMTVLLQLTAFMFWFNLLNGCLLAIPKALQRYYYCAVIEFLQNFLRMAIIIAIIWCGYGLLELIWGCLAVSLGFFLLLIICARRMIPYLTVCWPGVAGFRKVLNYGVFIFGGQMVGLLWQYGDNILLSYFVGPSAVAFFSVPMQLVGKCFQLISAGTSVLFPRFAIEGGKREADSDKVRQLYLNGTQGGLLCSIFICVPLTIMMPDFLRLWISPEFAEKAAMIGSLLAGSYMIRGAFLAYDALLKGLGYPRVIFFVTLASSLMIFFIDLIMIPFFGLNGVGFAYIISPVVGIITIIWIFRRLLDLNMKYFWMELVIPYLLGAGTLFLGLWIRSQAWWPQMNWGGFILLLMLFGSGNVIIVLVAGKLLGCHFAISDYKKIIRSFTEKFISV